MSIDVKLVQNNVCQYGNTRQSSEATRCRINKMLNLIGVLTSKRERTYTSKGNK